MVTTTVHGIHGAIHVFHVQHGIAVQQFHAVQQFQVQHGIAVHVWTIHVQTIDNKLFIVTI